MIFSLGPNLHVTLQNEQKTNPTIPIVHNWFFGPFLEESNKGLKVERTAFFLVTSNRIRQHEYQSMVRKDQDQVETTK